MKWRAWRSRSATAEAAVVVEAARPFEGPTRRPYQRSVSRTRSRTQRGLLLLVLAFVMGAYGVLFAALPPAFLLPLLAPIAVLALIVIWALPDIEAPPVKTMERTFVAFFVAVILWPYYLAVQIPGLPLIEPRRVFSVLSILCLLISLSTSSRFRGYLGDVIKANRTLTILMVAFVVIQAVSIAFSRYPGQGLATFIKNQMSWTAVFFISMFVFSLTGRIQRWVTTLCVLALILSVMGFLEYQNKAILWANSIPSFLRVNDPAMEDLLNSNFRAGEYRIVTTFSTSLNLAEFLALVMPFFIHGSVTAKRPLVRFACLIGDVLLITAAIMTQARVGVVGMLVAHAVYGLTWALRRWRTDKSGLIGPAATLAYPAVFGLLVAAVLSIGRLRVMTLGGGTHVASTQGRLEQAAAAGPVLMQSPIFGYGPRQGGLALGHTNQGGELSIDSYLLSMLLDYGIAGFLVYYGMFLFAIARALQVGSRFRSGEMALVLPTTVALCVWIVAKIVLSQQDSTTLSFMFLGLVAAVVYRASRASEGPPFGEGDRLRT